MRATAPRRRATPAPTPAVRVLPKPPAPPEPTPGSSLFQVLLPAVGGLGMVLFLLAGRQPLLLMAGALMLVVTVGGALGMAVSSQFGPRRRFVTARGEYLTALGHMREEIREVTRLQRRHDEELHPDPVALFARALAGEVVPRPAAEATLVRIGTATVPHPIQLALPDIDTDPVCARAMAGLAHAYRTLPRSPLLVDLSTGGIAVLGATDDTRALVRGLVLQAVAASSPEDLRLSIVTAEPRAFAWARWLPHVEDATGSVRIGPVVPDLSPLPATLSAMAPSFTGRAVSPPIDHLILLDGPSLPAGHVEVRAGQCVVQLGDDAGGAPSWIDVTPENVAVGGLDRDDCGGVPDLVDESMAESFARALAGRRRIDREKRPDVGPLGARVLGSRSLDAFDPRSTWAPKETDDLLTVLVGQDTDGADVWLDLKESGHGGTGPHGLLVGATGSGKSELLRSIVLGLAATHHPDDLAFVLVDYKGGATFSGLERLPHVAGVVTNLGDDLGLVDRMHTALLGEITRRQQVLHDAGRLPDIYAHRAARRENPELPPLPHLLVVVDEFAELLTATPDLLDLFTTIGRIGRSIGVHQLLASQRLDDGRLRGLESFLSYRFALRTFTAEESRAVIGSTQAAELPALPGAGYLRTVDTIRFQAAYVSAPEDTGRPTGPESVRRITWFDENAPAATTLGPSGSEPTSILDAAAARMEHAAAPTRPVWLPPLPSRLLTNDLDGPDCPGPYVARVGLLDLPAEQRTTPLDLDLLRGECHLAVLGGPDSGRSSTLRTIAHALARQHSPEELVIHGVDLDGDSLRPLAELPQVGSVAGRRDDELTRRILAEVMRTIDRRADSGRDGLPELVLLIDGYTTLKNADDLHESVIAIATRGAELGVHVILTASRWHDLRPALQTSLHSRIELRLADPMDSVVDRRLASNVPASCPGRALSADGHLAQISLPGDGVDERACYAALAQTHSTRATPVRLLPRDLRLADLLDAVGAPESGSRWIGLSEEDLAPVSLSADAPHVIVIGDRRTGRTSLLASLLQQHLTDPRHVIALIDPRRTLMEAVPRERLAGYATNVTAAHDLVLSLASELEARAAHLTGTDPVVTPQAPDSHIVLVVDDAELVMGGLNPLSPLEPYLPLAADIGFEVVVVRHSGGAARALYDPVLQRMKELGSAGVLLSGDPEEGPLWPSAPLRPLPPGRAVLARRGHSPTLVHLARP